MKGGTLAVLYGEAPGQVRDKRDLYVEPVEATSALLALERFPEPIWDPARGSGNILRALRKAGYTALYGSDISDEDDFLRMTIPVCERPGSIICNPPYRIADEFVLRALALAHGKVAMFLRLQWLEGSKRHERIFKDRRPHRVWVFKHRIGMQKGGVGTAHRDGMIAHMWVVWDQLAPPPRQTVVDWIGYR